MGRESNQYRLDDGFRFPPDVQPLDQSKTGERIIACRFKPLAEVMQSKDMFTLAAVGSLLSSLKAEEVEALRVNTAWHSLSSDYRP